MMHSGHSFVSVTTINSTRNQLSPIPLRLSLIREPSQKSLLTPSLRTSNYLDFNFCIVLVIAIIGGPILSISGGIERTWQALLVSLCLFSLCVAHFVHKRKYQLPESSSSKISQLFFIFQCIAVCLTFPTFYLAIAAVVDENGLPLHDQAFLELDQSLLGWLFPKGQLSLWVDANSFVNPRTFIGRLILEFLQVVYVSYYIWGFLLMFYLIGKSIQSWWKDGKEDKEMTTKLKILMCAWFASYLLTFFGNLMVPGVSPRIYLKNYFTHAQDGFGFSSLVTQSVGSFKTFATFPSGHVGETFVVALVALRITPLYGKIATVAAFLVAVATLWCRYHYLTDVLCTIPVILFSLMYGMVIPPSFYRCLINESRQPIPKLKTRAERLINKLV